MDKIIIHEYMLDGAEIKKLSHSAEVENWKSIDRYRLKAGKQGNMKVLFEEDFEVIKNNRIFSLEDNFEKYTDMLLHHLEKRYETKKQQLARDNILLKKLKTNIMRARNV